MSLPHSLTVTWGAGSDLIGTLVSVDADSEHNVSYSIPNDTENQPLNLDWGTDKLQALFISVSRDCTLYVNAASTGSPTDTISLKADVPFSWIKDSGMPEPFVGTAGAVTELYVTVPDDAELGDCDIEVRAAVDL